MAHHPLINQLIIYLTDGTVHVLIPWFKIIYLRFFLIIIITYFMNILTPKNVILKHLRTVDIVINQIIMIILEHKIFKVYQ